MDLQLKVFVSDQVTFIALDEPLAIIPANTSAIYTLVDSNGEPVIEDLVLKRKENDLEIEVDGESVASISDFYATEGPITYSVDGALNPAEEMAVQGGPSAVEDGIVWQASEQQDALGLGVWAGVVAAGFGAVAVGAYNDDESEPDTAAPSANLRAITDNQGTEQGLLDSGDSTDDTELVLSGTNEAGSTVQVYDGEEYLGDAVVDGTSWSYNAPVDDGKTYQFNTKETDTAGNISDATDGFEVTGDMTAPAFTSGTTATPIDENSGAGQEVYAAAATDADSALTYSLKGTNDDGLFSIDASTGVVTLTADPDFEDQPNYSLTVVATDAAGNVDEQIVSLAINDLDESAPTFSNSSATADAINENSGAGQVI
ncbi:MAG: hypothetical protein ACJAWL_003659, partial [Motiliproteus sp.]